MGKNKIILILILSFILIRCGTYTTSSYRPKIKSLLAITETGDTVSVSMREFEKQKYDTYTRFNYNNNWYWNSWRYNDPYFLYQYYGRWNTNYYWNNNYYVPRNYVRPKVKPKTRPKSPPPRTRPKLREPIERIRVNTPRGSNNQYTPRNTSTPRTRTAPNTQTRTNVGRRSTGGRRNNQ